MTSLKEVVDRIRVIAPTISSEPLVGARHVPDASAPATQCFSNAERKAQQDAGGVLYGWMFHYREVVALAGSGYLIAVNHAVWHAPDNSLVDVTPFHPDPKHHPITANGTVLFLIDGGATPVRNEHVGLALPSWFFPLAHDEGMAAHTAELAAKELAEWEKQIAAIERLQGSSRAADLVRLRRAIIK